MPRRKPGYGPDGTPKQPSKPSKPSRRFGPDGTPIHPSTPTRYWIPEKRGKDRDGFEWVIPGHWSDVPQYQPKPPKEPPVYMEHKCHIDGAFILVGGYIRIFDSNVPPGQRGHELYLKFGGLGIGGMDGSGVLHNALDSWDEFYNRVDRFLYIAAAPTIDVPISALAHTLISFRDKNDKIIGYAIPDVSADIGIAGGTVEVRT